MNRTTVGLGAIAIALLGACSSDSPGATSAVSAPDGGTSSAAPDAGKLADGGVIPTLPDGGPASRCPAFPAMPDAACTGVRPGTALKSCGTGRIILDKPNAVYEGCTFDGEVVVQAEHIRIESSVVHGRVDAGDKVPGNDLVLIDVEIDGSGDGGGNNIAGLGATGFSCTRCNIHGGGHGISAQAKARIEDSWIHDFTAVSADDHMGGIAAHGGSGVKVLHSVVECSYSGSFSGLCSSAVGMYGDFGQIDDYEFRNNLFNTMDGYGVYGGSSSSKPFPHATNVRYIDNLFGKKFNPKCGFYGPVSSFETGNAGNVWTGNRWEDGSGAVEAEN